MSWPERQVSRTLTSGNGHHLLSLFPVEAYGVFSVNNLSKVPDTKHHKMSSSVIPWKVSPTGSNQDILIHNV